VGVGREIAKEAATRLLVAGVSHVVRRAFRRSAPGGKADWLWTAALLNGDALASGATESINIVQPDDWERSSAGRETATLTRIRGNLMLANDSAFDGNYFAMIIVQDEDATIPTPNDITEYVEQDVLWTFAAQWPAAYVGVINAEIDVKAKRKISDNQRVTLVERVSGSSADIKRSLIARGLLDCR